MEIIFLIFIGGLTIFLMISLRRREINYLKSDQKPQPPKTTPSAFDQVMDISQKKATERQRQRDS